MTPWDVYNVWNRAIADVFFSEETGGLPAYLDLDGDRVRLLAGKLDLAEDEAWDKLARAVREVLWLRSGQHDVFGEPLRHLHGWLRMWRRTARQERVDLEPPPIIAVLAVFSMAAERMGSDGLMAPNNYFGRLAELLGVNDERQGHRLRQHYRRHAEFFWHVLAMWLTGLDGMRGLPSAVALSHRFIGLSVSQALVRAHDRDKLPKFFAGYGLSPGQEATPREMQDLLGEWFGREPPPISRTLAQLWRSEAAARERIAAVVAAELRAWDGAVPGGDPSTVSDAQSRGDVRLVVNRPGDLGDSDHCAPAGATEALC